MDRDGSSPAEVVPKSVVDQTNISTGIGPTGTDTPAPVDIMPKVDHLDHSMEEPLSRPPGALFQVGSGSVKLGEKKENIPEPISEEQPVTIPTDTKSSEN